MNNFLRGTIVFLLTTGGWLLGGSGLRFRGILGTVGFVISLVVLWVMALNEERIRENKLLRKQTDDLETELKFIKEAIKSGD